MKIKAEYADICGASESHLIIFDRRKNVSCEEKIYVEKAEYKGHKIKIWGM